MKMINSSIEIMDNLNGKDILKRIENIARTCYQSHDFTKEDSAERMVANLVKRDHLAMIEHVSISVKLIIDRGISHEAVRHRIASFCLTGDTLVRSINQKQWTIKDLYDWKSNNKLKGRLKLIKLRSVNSDNVIVPNSIKDIIYNGKKMVYELRTQSNRVIKSTDNHRFLTPNGYVELKDLKAGDFVLSNGIPAYCNEEWLRKTYLDENKTRKEVSEITGVCESIIYKMFKKFNIVKPHSQRPNRKGGYGKKGMFSESQRKDISDRMSKSNNHQYKDEDITNSGGYSRSNRWFKKESCELCDSKDNLHNHHIDKNPKNSDDTNIITLCQTCHKAYHTIGTLTVFKDLIISITPIGIEDTYDVSMKEEPHNFVANGIVVHNSQESQRYVNYSKDKFNNEITFVSPFTGFDLDMANIEHYEKYMVWYEAMLNAEQSYMRLIQLGCPPELARSVLPNSTKTELVMTLNLRSWMNFLKLRTAKTAHPAIQEVANMILKEFQSKIPIIFDNINNAEE